MSRLTSDFFASALIRQAGISGAFAGLRRRGGAEAGAIFVVIDRLDGAHQLYGPAAQVDAMESGERAFSRMHREEWVARHTVEARLEKEIRFDSDCWIIEIEDREGRHFLQQVV